MENKNKFTRAEYRAMLSALLFAYGRKIQADIEYEDKFAKFVSLTQPEIGKDE